MRHAACLISQQTVRDPLSVSTMAYDNPEGLIAETVILELLAATCIGMRFLARRKRQLALAADDWLMVAALIGATGLSVMQIWGCATGVLGRPLSAALEQVATLTGRVGHAERIELATIVVGVPTLGLIRLSIAFLYKRIFITRSFVIFTWIWIGLVSSWTVGFILAGLFECDSHLWALFDTPGTYHQYCSSSTQAGYAMVGTSVAMDLITLIIPLPMVMQLQVSNGRKFLLSAIFTVGLLSVGAGIGKAYIYVTASLGESTLDGITTITAFSVWNLIEIQIGIIAGCSISMRPVLAEIIPSDSLVALVQSMRHRGSGKHSSEKSSCKQISSDNIVPLQSEEYLVQAFHATAKGQAEASGGCIRAPEA